MSDDPSTPPSPSTTPPIVVPATGRSIPAGVSFMEYLGMISTPRTDFVPVEPPSLDGIHDLVVNFETTGLHWQQGDRPIGVTVGTLDGQKQWFLPFAFAGGNLDEATVRRWAQRELRDKHITNAHTKFDVHQARMFGVDLEAQGCTVSDVQHYAALLDDHRYKFSIDTLATDYLGGIEVPRVDESRMASYHASDVARRAEYQCVLVSQLRAAMWPQLDAQDLQRVRQLEDDVIFPVVEMEKNGAPIDTEKLARFKAECEQIRDQLLGEVSEEVGFAFSFSASSWKRVFEKYSLPVQKLDTGNDTFAEHVITQFDHPVIRKAHRASQYDSLNNKVFKPYTNAIGADGILWFDLNQLRSDDGGTVSGRFSAAYIQQVPNKDNHFAAFGDRLYPRELYVPGSGEYFAADAMQIEYRIFAHHARNPKVLAAYRDDPLMSFHKMTWKMFLERKPDMLYSRQKTLNFATLYGAQLLKIAVMMGIVTQEVADEIRADGTSQTDPRLKEAREIQQIFRQLMPEADTLLKLAAHLAAPACNDYCLKSARSRELHRRYPHRGYVTTLLGRRARFLNHYGLHKAFNRVDQGTGADILKTKMVEVHRERKRLGFTPRMTVHDELAGDVADKESAALVLDVLNRQSFPELLVPILWEGSTGRNWAECK